MATNPPEPTPPPAENPAPAPPAEKGVIPPEVGEQITSSRTQNTYTMGAKIGEGAFSIVYACTDFWDNEVAAKVLKPQGTYEHVQAAAVDEFGKLLLLRHPYITFVHDAFEFRDTFYIVTERCAGSLNDLLFPMAGLIGQVWVMPIARCLLQAVHYLHINDYVHQD